MQVKASSSAVLNAARIERRNGAAMSSQAITSQREKKAHSFRSALDKLGNQSSEHEPARAMSTEELRAMENGDEPADTPPPIDTEAIKGMAITGGVVSEMSCSSLILRERNAQIKEANAPSLFSVADVERIVHSFEKSIGIDGAPEVTLEFAETVAEGLIVKLGTDTAGRVRVELMIANAQSRMDVEARLPSLIDQLHARGIETAQVKVSIGGGNAHRQEQQRHNHQHHQLPNWPFAAAKIQDAQRLTEAIAAHTPDAEHAATYLA